MGELWVLSLRDGLGLGMAVLGVLRGLGTYLQRRGNAGVWIRL